MMDFQPRKLSVFDRVERKTVLSVLPEKVRLSIHGMVLIALIVHRQYARG